MFFVQRVKARSGVSIRHVGKITCAISDFIRKYIQLDAQKIVSLLEALVQISISPVKEVIVPDFYYAGIRTLLNN